jgi:hypothetical protein
MRIEILNCYVFKEKTKEALEREVIVYLAVNCQRFNKALELLEPTLTYLVFTLQGSSLVNSSE